MSAAYGKAEKGEAGRRVRGKMTQHVSFHVMHTDEWHAKACGVGFGESHPNNQAAQQSRTSRHRHCVELTGLYSSVAEGTADGRHDDLLVGTTGHFGYDAPGLVVHELGGNHVAGEASVAPNRGARIVTRRLNGKNDGLRHQGGSSLHLTCCAKVRPARRSGPPAELCIIAQTKPQAMKLIINLLLLGIAAVLVWALASSISEPIAFGDELNRRRDAVVDRLKDVRTAQQLYRDVTGAGFAHSFDTLESVLRGGNIPIVSVYGDVDDPNFDGVIRYDTVFVPARDSIERLGISIDSLRYVPYSGKKQFELRADTTTYQSTLVDVVEVKTYYRDFMGPFADQRFSRYDQNYDPSKPLKFGNLNSPSLSGSWD